MKPFQFYIVEDEPIITMTISLMLKKHGYCVVGTNKEHDAALAEIKFLKPHIVLIDIRLEGKKDGIALAHKLDNYGIKYIYLSSLADPVSKATLSQTKYINFIDKPFTENGLITQIEKYAFAYS